MKWPEGVSDGLTLPCGVCGVVPKFDYRVTPEAWRAVLPKGEVSDDLRLGVVCLPCFDRLATTRGIDIGPVVLEVQYTGIGKTICLTPTRVHTYLAVTS